MADLNSWNWENLNNENKWKKVYIISFVLFFLVF